MRLADAAISTSAAHGQHDPVTLTAAGGGGERADDRGANNDKMTINGLPAT